MSWSLPPSDGPDRGFRRVRLWVNDTNAAVARLYERQGFTPTGGTETFRLPRDFITERELTLEL